MAKPSDEDDVRNPLRSTLASAREGPVRGSAGKGDGLPYLLGKRNAISPLAAANKVGFRRF